MGDMGARLRDVEGWFTTEEAVFLEELARGQVCLEIGCYKGRSTLAMALVAEKVLCVDHFHPAYMGQGYDAEAESILPEFMANLAEWLQKIEVHEARSEDLIDHDWPELGLLFLDGGHDEELIKDVAFYHHLKVGGYIAFHDCQWHTVSAVIEHVLLPLGIWEKREDVSRETFCVFRRVA